MSWSRTLIASRSFGRVWCYLGVGLPLQIACLQARSVGHQWDSEITGIEILMKAYALDNNGMYPTSWTDLERQYGKDVWDSKAAWEKVKRMAVFLPLVQGDWLDPELGKTVRATMWVVLVDPLTVPSRTTRSIGRWVIWKTPEGVPYHEWNSEEEIQRFSAWPQIQVLVGTVKKAQAAEHATPIINGFRSIIWFGAAIITAGGVLWKFLRKPPVTGDSPRS